MAQVLLISYREKDSYIHKLNPLTKLLFVACIIILSFALKNFIYNLILFATIIPLAYASKLLRQVFVPIKYLFIIFVLIYGIQSFFYPFRETILLQLPYGFAIWSEGVTYATDISARLLVMMVYGYLFVLTTHPGDLISALRKIHFSYKFGYVIIATLQMIPRIMLQMETIIDAQKSRGLETRGNLINRLKSYTPLLGPLFLGSVQNAVERTIALESRAFSLEGEKTSYRQTVVRKKDKILMAASVTLSVFYGVISWVL